MRILVTGSRDWTDRDTLNEALNNVVDAWVNFEQQRFLTEGVTLVSGRCRTGADKMAEEWAEPIFHVDIEPHPADWAIGNSAGFRRNADMVNLGADVCVAFLMPCTKKACAHKPVHWSHGTAHTMGLADKAGITVIPVESPS